METLIALKAELKSAIEHYEALRAEANRASNAAWNTAQAGVQAALDAAQQEYEEACEALVKEFGFPASGYPKGMTESHPVAKEYEARWSKLEETFEEKKSDILQEPNRVSRRVFNDFPGFMEARNKMSTTKVAVIDMWEAEKMEYRLKIEAINGKYEKLFKDVIPEEWEF